MKRKLLQKIVSVTVLCTRCTPMSFFCQVVYTSTTKIHRQIFVVKSSCRHARLCCALSEASYKTRVQLTYVHIVSILLSTAATVSTAVLHLLPNSTPFRQFSLTFDPLFRFRFLLAVLTQLLIEGQEEKLIQRELSENNV